MGYRFTKAAISTEAMNLIMKNTLLAHVGELTRARLF